MNITCKVNQSVAITRGFNADSTIKLDVDVTTLTDSQRAILGEYFSGGDFRKEHAQYPQHRSWDVWPEIPTPTMDGLREKLDEMHAARVAAAAKVAAEQAENDAKIAEFRAAFRAEPEKFVAIYSDGSNPFLRDFGYLKTTLSMLDENERATFDAHVESLREKNRLRIEAEQADKAAKAAERSAREAAEKAAADARQIALDAQRKAYLDAHPGPLAERFAAGYASTAEVDDAIRDEVRAALGVTFTGGDDDWSKDDSDRLENPVLTDEQFSELKAWKAKLPEDAQISLCDMHDHADNGYGDKDDETKIDRILVADARWTVGQITVCADEQIGTLPDVTKDEDEA